jgi:hypothetical protein
VKISSENEAKLIVLLGDALRSKGLIVDPARIRAVIEGEMEADIGTERHTFGRHDVQLERFPEGVRRRGLGEQASYALFPDKLAMKALVLGHLELIESTMIELKTNLAR